MTKLRLMTRAILVGFASLFSFGDPDRHFSEPPAILQPVAADEAVANDGEPER
jgi:hypothetical protein